MMLLSPLILALVFGSMFLSGAMNPPPSVRPLMADAAVALVLFGMTQFVGNQFGFDRSGFRVYVLMRPRAAISCWARTWRSPRWRWG